MSRASAAHLIALASNLALGKMIRWMSNQFDIGTCSNRELKMKQTSDELLTFYKALVDASRLTIIGLLAQGEYAVEQIAEMLGLRPSTVSHHLSKLLRASPVSARPEITTILIVSRRTCWGPCH